MIPILEALHPLVVLILGGAMAVLGAKMHDELIRGLGLTIVGTALGITIPGVPRRDPNTRTRSTDAPERRDSGQ